jgi:hemoglobin
MPSLYDRLGGRDAVRLAVDQLYDRLVADPELAPYFTGKDIGRLTRHMRPFIAAAVGGPELYRGRDMRAAHAGLGITGAHFDRTVEHVVAVLSDLGVDAAVIDEVGATLEPLRALVVEAAPERMAA